LGILIQTASHGESVDIKMPNGQEYIVVMAVVLRCDNCHKAFERKPRARKDTLYCSKKCANRGKYLKTKAHLHKPRVFLTPEQREERKHIWWHNAYMRRKSDPIKWSNYLAQVRARNPLRRDYWRNRWRQANFYGVDIPAPYTGHMWMDKIRAMVGPMPDQSAPWADKYNDMVGEGLLAFLEGRDPAKAIKDFRNGEYISEYRTIYLSDFADNPRTEKWYEGQLQAPRIDTGGSNDLNEVSEARERSERLSGPVYYVPNTKFKWAKGGWHMKAGSSARHGGRGPKKSHMVFRPNDNKKDHRGIVRRMKYTNV
jgi:hypothetical protein